MPRNAPIHPFLRFIYLLLRITAWVGTSIFYCRRIVLGREHLNFDGPAIIVVNHPSTLMDVLNACLHIRQEAFFLANYGLFKNPVMGWILTRLYCIPVKRREDVAEGEARNNDAAFEQSFRHLEKGGVLFIAAEGVSFMERWVRPFKTGAARIAFGAEKRNNWQLGVKIIPVGLSYDAANLFRSDMTVYYGKPMMVAPQAAAEQADHEQAVDDFTVQIHDRVRSLVLDTRDQAGQEFMEQLECMLRDEFPKEPVAYFDFRKSLIENNIENEALRIATADYQKSLEAAGLTDEGLKAATSKRNNTGDLLFLLAGLPFFLAGYIFWWLPCYLPWLTAKKLNLYIGYDSNVKMVIALFTFPLALWGAYALGGYVFHNGYFGLVLVAVMIPLAYFTERYLDVSRRWRAARTANALKKNDVALFTMLTQQRENIVKKALTEV